jgi:Zn-dependent M28 family amino/carboxypeptidase
MKIPRTSPEVERVVKSVSRQKLERTVRTLAAIPTRHTLADSTAPDALLAQMLAERQSNLLECRLDRWIEPAGRRIPKPSPLTNVYGVLEGTETPERVIIVSGHYDSRVTDVLNATSPAPGANDDASGTAVVMELARLLSYRQWPATIIFACVTGEEQGLLGSAHLAEQMKFENRKVIAMLTNDIVGNSKGQNGVKDDRHIRVFSASYDTARTRPSDTDVPSRTLARGLRDAARRYVKHFEATLVLRNDRFGRGGDHTPFLERGFPAIRLTEPNEDWRHQHQDLRTENGIIYGDLPEYVDYKYLSNVAKVNAALVTELALAPAAPARLDLLLNLDVKTSLSWSSVPEAVAYEVLWRRTTAPDWEKSQVTETTKIVLSQSKDDHVFGVRSIGKDGSRSLPAVA